MASAQLQEKASTLHLVVSLLRGLLVPLLVLLLAVQAGEAAAATPQKTPTLMGQAHAQEWVPAQDLNFLRPQVSSKDVLRPACELPAGSGKFTGVCTEEISESPKLMGFCGDLVRYRACVPAHQVLWPNWNATAKDLLLKDLFKDMVERRIARERNVSEDLYVPIHYMSNPDCVNSLRNALCWYNFPKCDDSNRSLSLCTSTCNEYYSKCKYVPDETGAFPACGAEVASEGLFQAGVRPGPDQALALDRPDPDVGSCQRYPSDEEMGITAEEVIPAWYTTWWGIILLSLAGLVVTAFLSWGLIPPVLMSYLIKTAKRVAWSPIKFWLNLPHLRGRKVLAAMVVTFATLVGVGIYQMWHRGFARWDKWEDPTDFETFQFKPAQIIWGTQASKRLTNQQLRQLKHSCTCTGAAHRGLPGIVALTAATALSWLLV